MVVRITLLASLLFLAACASPSQRIARKLGEYGVPPGQAQCMGDRLANRLSTSQLRRLGEISRLNPDRIGRMRVDEIARALDDPQDPRLVSEVIRTGIVCLI
jgi:hypothetical protein